MKVNNIKKVKSSIDNFYYDKLSLKNEDNSYFDITPLVETNLGYFPITGIHKTKVEQAIRISTKNYYIDVVKDDHTLLSTNEEQPIWVNIRELNIGDKIMTITGEEEIISIKDVDTNGQFFDFRVDPTHSYFTNGILSHNSMIALSMMREPSIDLIVYMDSEGGGVTKEFAEFLNIDTGKILYTPIDTIEDLITRMERVIDIVEKNKSSKNVLMVIDSISMLTTEREKDPKGGSDMGCYTPDTLVNVLKENEVISKYIKDISVGDRVLTHLNTWEEVTDTFTYTKEEKPELVEIETEDGDVIKLTPNHKLLVDRSGLQWIEAGELLETDLLQRIE